MRTARGRRRIWRAARRAAEQARDSDRVEETQSQAEEAEGEKWRRKKWEEGEPEEEKATPCTLSSTSLPLAQQLQPQQPQQHQRQQQRRQQCACSDGGNDHRCPQAERVGSEDALHFTVIDVNVLLPKELDEIVVKRHFPASVRVSLSCVLVYHLLQNHYSCRPIVLELI